MNCLLLGEKPCYIFGSAEISDYSCVLPVQNNGVIISADGGLHHLLHLGLKPDYMIGDMDSLREEIPENIFVERYPSEKDDTDMFLAVKKGLALDCDSFYLYGGLGGRLGHTLANIQMLFYLEKIGKKAALIDSNHIVYALCNGSVCFDPLQTGKISVFSFSESALGVTITGLKYPLKDAVLINSYALGVSNEFIGKKSEISVKKGDLLIVLEKNQK